MATVTQPPVSQPEDAPEIQALAAPYFRDELRFDPDVVASLGCPELAAAMRALDAQTARSCMVIAAASRP